MAIQVFGEAAEAPVSVVLPVSLLGAAPDSALLAAADALEAFEGAALEAAFDEATLADEAAEAAAPAAVEALLEAGWDAAEPAAG